MPQEAAAANSPAPTDDDVALERALEGLFRLSAGRRFDARQAKAVGAEVTRAGYAVLRSLADHGRLRARELAATAHMDAATASRQVSQLVDDGLVVRETADDARAVELSLSPRGHTVYQRIVDHRVHHLADVLGSWPRAERGELARLVERLTDDLGRRRPPGPSTGSGPGPDLRSGPNHE